MADNELLYGLIGLGCASVVLVLCYNAWQERKHRRTAEKAFRSEHRDVLLEGDAEEPAEPAFTTEPVNERIEPAASRIAPTQPIGRMAEPELPGDARAIDCVVRIEAPAGIQGGALVSGAGGPLSQIKRPIAWYALSEETHRWLPLDANEQESYTRFAVALQLADRRGPISERDYDVFIAAIERVCEQFPAVPQIGEREETLELAQHVDQFCAAVDVQIALNIVAGNHPFAGTKIRGLAEAEGLKLEGDDCFHKRDEDGHTLFVVSNLDPGSFPADALKKMASSGLTLSIDVPSVADGVRVFDRMVVFARHLAHALGGKLVDDNRRELNEVAITTIRNEILGIQDEMKRLGIPAGSPLALRLFA